MNIEEIKIVIKTAIPGKDPFEFKSNMVYIPDSSKPVKNLNDYPFITASTMFDKTALQAYVNSSGYSTIVKFFFVKREFEKLLSQFTIKSIENTSSSPLPPPSAEEVRKNLIHNVKIMLELLFPMSFPATLNVTDSFNLYIKQNIDFDLNTAFSNVSKHFFKSVTAVTSSIQTKYFSYLKIDGNVYTVTKLIWLNDLLNHPIYRDFINEFIGFIQLAQQQKQSLEGVIKDKTTTLFERIQIDTSTMEDTRNSLNIYYGYIEKFVNNIPPNIVKSGSLDSQRLEKFNNDLKQLIILLIRIAYLHIDFTIDINGSNNTSNQSIDDFVKQLDEAISYITTASVKKSNSKRRGATQIDIDEYNAAEEIANKAIGNFKLTNIQPKSIESNYLSELIVLMNDVFDIYNRLKSSNIGTLTGIPPEFLTRITNINNEIKSITTNNIIKDKYLSENANINLEGENPDVVSELTKNFPTYITYSNKIKALLSPERSTTNTDLQNIIISYSKGKSQTDANSFDNLMKAIQQQYVLMTKKTKNEMDLNNPSIQSLLNTEVSILDQRKQNVPHYEIYIALNLIEGEYKNENVDDIKCIYRGMYLGKEMQNYFIKYNKYDIQQHLFYLSQKTIKNEKLLKPFENSEDKLPLSNTPPSETENQVLPPVPPVPPPSITNGGNTKKHKKIIIKRNIKTRKYMKRPPKMV